MYDITEFDFHKKKVARAVYGPCSGRPSQKRKGGASFTLQTPSPLHHTHHITTMFAPRIAAPLRTVGRVQGKNTLHTTTTHLHTYTRLSHENTSPPPKAFVKFTSEKQERREHAEMNQQTNLN